MLGRHRRGCRWPGHDARVVTLLVEPPLELPLELVLLELVLLELVPPAELVVLPGLLVVVVVVAVGVLVVVVDEEPLPEDAVGVVLVLVIAAAVELLRAASAGSWPETSTTAISSQAARNSATAPLRTRRRILRMRAARASRIAWPRARTVSGLFSLMVNPQSRSGSSPASIAS
jgi:hypothetical protein